MFINELDQEHISRYPDENKKVLYAILEKNKSEGNKELTFLNDFEGGLIGYCRNPSGNLIGVYDYDKSLEFMARLYMEDSKLFPTYDDAYSGALDWFDFNTIRSLPYDKDSLGKSIAPVFIQSNPDTGEYQFIAESLCFTACDSENGVYTDMHVLVSGTLEETSTPIIPDYE